MKKLLFLLIALTTLTLIGCENDGESSSSKFDGEWAIVADYDDEDGWDYYYDESWYYIVISGNSLEVYEPDNWGGYSFKNGYYYCSRSNFRYSFDASFTIEGKKAYFNPNEDEYTYMEIKNNKLYLYDSDTPEDGYCEVYERVNGFKGN